MAKTNHKRGSHIPGNVCLSYIDRRFPDGEEVVEMVQSRKREERIRMMRLECR